MELDDMVQRFAIRIDAMERRQDAWIADANRTLVDLRDEVDRTLRELRRLMKTIDEIV